MNSLILIESAKTALRFFIAAPGLFLVLHLPEALLSLLDAKIESYATGYYWLVFLVAVPIYVFTSLLSTSLTCAAVVVHKRQGFFSLQQTLQFWRPYTWSFVRVALLLSVILCVSLPLVLPAIYFLTLYIFAPQAVLVLPKTTALAYLGESKRWVHPQKFRWLAFTCLLLGTLLGLAYFIPKGLQWLFPTWGSGMYYLDALLQMIPSALANLWLSVIYLKRTQL